MKPAKFDYHAPTTVEETVDILRDSPEEAKILAGGQSLVPSMNFRLARPTILVDINNVEGIDGVSVSGDRLSIGTLVRHRRLEQSVTNDPVGSLLSAAAHFVGHLPIRTRGTFGGSICHVDPAAEWCLIATALDAEMVAMSVEGQRRIAAADFFETVFTTSLQPDEMLTEVTLPLLGGDARIGFAEFSRRAGDFAIVAAAVAISVTDGIIRSASLGLGGVGPTAVRALEAETVLVGHAPSRRLFDEAGTIAAANVEPLEDIHGSADYRKDLVRAMVRKALDQTIEGSDAASTTAAG